MENKKIKSFERGKSRALHILAKTSKTENELRQKLIKNEYSEQVIDKIIMFLKEYGYINDFEYASNYVECRKNHKSFMQMRMALRLKGVGTSIIEEVLENKKEDQSELIKSIAEKKIKNIDKVDRNTMNKVYKFIYSKGFKSNEIITVLKELEGNIK